MAKFCVLCNGVDGHLVKLTGKGVESMTSAAVTRGIEDRKNFVVGSMVHEDCRREYACKRNIEMWKKRQDKAINPQVKPTCKRTRSCSTSKTNTCCFAALISITNLVVRKMYIW